MKQRLPKSIRRYIRKEKARIRRVISDPALLKEEFKKLYQKFGILREDKKVG